MLDRFENLRADARYAWRSLARAPGFSIAVALTFALGIGVNAVIFAVVDRLLLQPPAHVADPQGIVKLAAGSRGGAFGQQTMSYPVFKAVRDQSRGFSNVTATYGVTLSIGRGEAAQSAQGLLVTGNYFHLLGAAARLGRVIIPQDDAEPTGEPVVVLDYGYWMSRMDGDPRVLGAPLAIADRTFRVIGVMPPEFSGLDVTGPDMWIPMSAGAAQLAAGPRWATNANGSWLTILARVRSGVPADRAAADAMRIARDAAPATWFTGPTWTFAALPVLSLRGSGEGMSVPVARVLAAMSIIVLLIACANVANLLLARGFRRREEIAVRLALGVSRVRLMSHLLMESALLAFLGGGAALAVAYWGGGVVFKVMFTDLHVRGAAVNTRVFAFTACLTILAGALTGLLPAWQVSRPDLASVLKSGARDTGSRSRTRSLLLVAQAALSVVLLFAAGLFVRSLARLSDVRMGVDVDRVMVASMNLRAVGRSATDADEIFTRALERVSALPGVSSAAVAATVPLGQSFGLGVTIHSPDSLIHTDAMVNVVTPKYLRTLGARILRGRDFTSGDGEGAPRVMIVNEMWATRYFGRRDPIGQCVVAGDDSLPCVQIVGIAENVRRQSIFEDSTGFVYLPLAQARHMLSARQLVARVDHGDPASVIAAVRRAMQTAAPQLPYADVQLLADVPTVRREFRPYRLGAMMFGVFGALALALAAVGLYGVISYDVGQRTREIGVRLALGAPRANVAGRVVRDGVAVAAAGVAIGAFIALTAGKAIGSLLYSESARDPVVLAAVAGVLIATGVAASLVPAWRAVNTDPVQALRSE